MEFAELSCARGGHRPTHVSKLEHTYVISRIAPTLNVSLRMATLGTRFLLVFILAKFLDTASVGAYGLFTAAVGYMLLFIGMDFYVYMNRELLKSADHERGRLIKAQTVWIGILYLFWAPIVFYGLPYLGLPHFLAWWFVPIILLEHINQEIYRLLIILSRQLAASCLLFVRQGSWALAITLSMALNENARTLQLVVLLWAIAGATAALAGIWTVHRMNFGGWRDDVDWSWIKRGVMVSGAFLVSSLALRGIQTFDRYWLEFLAGIDIVGVYVLFFGMTSALNVFLDAALYSFKYPQLVKLCHAGDYSTMRRLISAVAFKAVLVCFLFFVGTYQFLPMLLSWIGRSIYQSEIGLYYWILAGTVAYSLSMIPHYALYALGRDRAIIITHVIALPIFAFVTLIVSYWSRLYAVPAGVFASMIFVLIGKLTFYLKFSPPAELHHQAL